MLSALVIILQSSFDIFEPEDKRGDVIKTDMKVLHVRISGRRVECLTLERFFLFAKEAQAVTAYRSQSSTCPRPMTNIWMP